MAANKAAAGSVEKRRILATVVHYFGTDCGACGRATVIGGSPRDGLTFNLGHVTACTNGGSYDVPNLRPLCRRCNAFMGETDWMLLPIPAPLTLPSDWTMLPDPGTGESNMERPDWA